MISKTYCSRPFYHIYNDSQGRFRLCCHAKADKSNPLHMYNSNQHLPFDVFFSEEMEKVRDQMFNGEYIEACGKCYEIENTGAMSPRLRAQNPMFEVGSVQLKLRIFGNSCSLSCYMCSPYNSSTRLKEVRDMNLDRKFYDFGVSEFDSKPKKKFFDDIIQNLIDNIHHITQIYITGGEPFQLPKHYEFLDRIPEKYARNIHVRYDTNLTILEYKGKSIFETLKKFASFGFMVSSDHYGDKLEYIRYPIDVNQFERNLEYVQTKYNAIARIGCTVSMLNIEDLDNILIYYEDKFGITNAGYTSAVIRPSILSIQNHRDKEQLIKKYENYWQDPEKIIIGRLKEPFSADQWNRGIDYLKSLDKHRGTNYEELWPHYKHIDA